MRSRLTAAGLGVLLAALLAFGWFWPRPIGPRAIHAADAGHGDTGMRGRGEEDSSSSQGNPVGLSPVLKSTALSSPDPRVSSSPSPGSEPATSPSSATWLELTDGDNGRSIFAGALSDGEPLVLTWTNSLFHLKVTEVFVARDGHLEQTEVTFADPRGQPPPRANPSDLDDLYHTGGPFRVEGLSRRIDHATFRVGQIGDPELTIHGRQIRFKTEVGFGGRVCLTARRPTPHETNPRH